MFAKLFSFPLRSKRPLDTRYDLTRRAQIG